MAISLISPALTLTLTCKREFYSKSYTSNNQRFIYSPSKWYWTYILQLLFIHRNREVSPPVSILCYISYFFLGLPGIKFDGVKFIQVIFQDLGWIGPWLASKSLCCHWHEIYLHSFIGGDISISFIWLNNFHLAFSMIPDIGFSPDSPDFLCC